MCLRVCSLTGLIKTQNVFAHKKLKNSNALSVQKLSGWSIYRQAPCGRRTLALATVYYRYRRVLGIDL